MLDKEFNFYNKNQKGFLAKYNNKVLVIKDENIVGIYDDEATAYKESISRYKLGTFLIQRCIPEKETHQTFHSRATVS